MCGQLPPQASKRGNQACLSEGRLYVPVAFNGSEELVLLRTSLSKLTAESWEQVPLPAGGPWNYHCYLLTYNGVLYVILAKLDRSKPHDVYRLTSNDTWEYLSSFPLMRMAFGAGVCGREIAIVGGYCGIQYGADDPVLTPELFDPSAGEWSHLPRLPQYCKSPTVIKYDGSLHAIGGHGYVGDNHHSVLSLDIAQSPERRSWVRNMLPSVPYRRCGVAVINNQLVLAAGQGSDRQSTSKSVLLLDRNSQRWIELPPLQQEQFSPRLISDGNCLICFGGFNAQGQFIRDIEVLKIDMDAAR